MSPTSYRAAPPRDDKIFTLEKMEEVEGFEPPRDSRRLSVFKTDPFSRTWVYLHEGKRNILLFMSKPFQKKMEEVEGFEPPRDSRRLSVFKTDPFSRTWVYLRDI